MSKLGIDSRLYSAAGLTTVADMARRYASSAFRKRKRVPASRARARGSKRARFAKSRPRRKFKKGTKNIQGKNVSVKNIGRKLPRVYYPAVKATSGQVYDFNQAFNITSQQGRQGFDEIGLGTCNNGTALNNVGPGLFNSNNSDLGNVFINVFGNGVAAFDTSRQGKILVRSISLTVYYTNMIDGYLHFTIYDVVPRRDTDQSPLTNYLQGLRAAYDGADTNGTEVISNASVSTLVGADLGQSPYFNSKYMIVNRRTIIMTPGQVHRHTLNYKVNKVLNSAILDSQNIYMRGFSAVHICKIHGFPADNADNTITTLQAAKVSVVYRKRIKYHVIEQSKPTRYTYNNIEDDGIALENMNEDGDVEAQANA